MAWQAIDLATPVEAERDGDTHLSDAVRDKIRSFFPRYETKRAALLPALHIVQNALGHIGPKAMVEIADLLEIPPSHVLDTMSFYTHFWDHPKGRKVIVACRSLSCQLNGGQDVLQALKDELGIDEHGTTADGEYSLMTEECLAACDHGPCVLINEKLHKRVAPRDVPKILQDPENDVISVARSDLFDAPSEPTTAPGAADDAPPETPGDRSSGES
ncbi:MAG: NAD(P)H-dependent oxidoreductase subunit E [Planctomycetes bacterium]|nr:NAD(P)H-dependent oxidoreductase subunit E [Planctomycetota bacterium]